MFLTHGVFALCAAFANNILANQRGDRREATPRAGGTILSSALNADYLLISYALRLLLSLLFGHTTAQKILNGWASFSNSTFDSVLLPRRARPVFAEIVVNPRKVPRIAAHVLRKRIEGTSSRQQSWDGWPHELRRQKLFAPRPRVGRWRPSSRGTPLICPHG